MYPLFNTEAVKPNRVRELTAKTLSSEKTHVREKRTELLARCRPRRKSGGSVGSASALLSRFGLTPFEVGIGLADLKVRVRPVAPCGAAYRRSSLELPWVPPAQVSRIFGVCKFPPHLFYNPPTPLAFPGPYFFIGIHETSWTWCVTAHTTPMNHDIRVAVLRGTGAKRLRGACLDGAQVSYASDPRWPSPS